MNPIFAIAAQKVVTFDVSTLNKFFVAKSVFHFCLIALRIYRLDRLHICCRYYIHFALLGAQSFFGLLLGSSGSSFCLFGKTSVVDRLNDLVEGAGVWPCVYVCFVSPCLKLFNSKRIGLFNNISGIMISTSMNQLNVRNDMNFPSQGTP